MCAEGVGDRPRERRFLELAALGRGEDGLL